MVLEQKLIREKAVWFQLLRVVHWKDLLRCLQAVGWRFGVFFNEICDFFFSFDYEASFDAVCRCGLADIRRSNLHASFSPFGHPTQVNSIWVTSINLLLANEKKYSLLSNFFLGGGEGGWLGCTYEETCESVWPPNASLYKKTVGWSPRRREERK